MAFSVKHLFITLILTTIRSTSTNRVLLPQVIDVSNNGTTGKYADKHISKDKIQLLRVTTAHFDPYIYQDSNSSYYDGFEYNLLTMIANESNVTLSLQTALKHTDICNNVISKYTNRRRNIQKKNNFFFLL